MFNSFLNSTFSDPISHPPCFPPPTTAFYQLDISESDVYEALSSLDPQKSSGPHGISPALLKYCAVPLTEPLHKLFVMSIRSGQLPDQWKLHLIVPVFKSGNKADVKNYCPISLLCTVSKVLEKIVYSKIIDFVYPQISTYQYGFLKGKSSVLKLLLSISHIVDSIDAKHSMDAIFLDVRKAFDSVCHLVLLSKLKSIGFAGEVLSWFKGYLDNRHHCVRLEGHISSKLPVKSGVPQGSILGPILFLLYVNDIFPCASHSHLSMFADDTECLKELTSTQDSTSDLLQKDLNQLVEWCNVSLLRFNASKCVLLRFGPVISSPIYTVHGDFIPLHTSHKNLGVLFMSDLSWSSHIASILVKAYRFLSLIKRVVPYSSNINLKRSLYLTLVRCHLSYCSPVWRPHLLQDSRKLESLQCRATKFITSYDMDYKSRLIATKLLPVSLWLETQDVLFLIKLMIDPPSGFCLDEYLVHVILYQSILS